MIYFLSLFGMQFLFRLKIENCKLKIYLALALLMLCGFANNNHTLLASDDLAILADFLD